MKVHHLILLLALVALTLLATVSLIWIPVTPQTSRAASVTADRPSPLGPQGYFNAIRAEVEFEAPYRLRTIDGEYVAVESPGYACPTLADIDDDGDLDLIVVPGKDLIRPLTDLNGLQVASVGPRFRAFHDVPVRLHS